MGRSTEGPIGGVRMRSRHPFWHTPHASCRYPLHMVRGPMRSATEDDIHSFGTHNCIWMGCSLG
eukprot:5597776-Pyramimonas_sp.AAC.1